ncbi:haloacid dehalogenase [Sulfobacillus sp. DSM 109850]|uniref:Haloacid dehalogenase n=1 Tax=Sulfobacillus harzensis TaxID=2729629 RepID=A0A7Y0L230_9FIRM|nr:haloacid dehalogenase [Sulfobacillus harzensis]
MDQEIPGREPLHIRHLVLDFNGTLAEDGQVAASTARRLAQVAERFHALIATADTYGTVTSFAERLGMECHVIRATRDKEALVRSLPGGVAAIGNGANDRAMLEAADLAIAVIGPEGAALGAVLAANIVVRHIDDGLDLLLYPSRLVATLRE